MSGVHMIVVKNQKFGDIPVSDFYFEDIDPLLESLELLFSYDYEVNLFLDLDVLTDDTLDLILSKNKNYKTVFLNKNDKINYYKKKFEVLI